MDRDELSSESVLETLLKTNRPPTDQETAIIQESMAPANAELKVVEAQISETIAHIQELESQVEQAVIKLQRLHEQEAAILDSFADHRRVLSAFRNIPEDVLREICVQACVKGDIPTLSYFGNPLPYVLAQICSEMRYIALTTPIIWTSMHVEIHPLHFDSLGQHEQVYSTLARRASTWFERAGGLGLTVFIQESIHSYVMPFIHVHEPHPSTILFDTLLSYSTRWKELEFDSRCGYDGMVSAPMIRIVALRAVDVPLLQSVTFYLDLMQPDSRLDDSVLLKVPTLKRVKLHTRNGPVFTVNWAILTSITLDEYSESNSHDYLVEILQQTKGLVFGDIGVGLGRLQEHYPDNINLPFLKTFFVRERNFGSATSGARSILDLITAPILEIFYVRREAFLDFSGFFKRSPRIRKLSMPYFDKDTLLTDTMAFLGHCPSLTELSLFPGNWMMDAPDANRFLRAFVEGDTGVICPRLQDFQFEGIYDFSLQTLRLFLEGRQRGIAARNVMPWKRLVIDIGGIKDREARQQASVLLLQKNAAGVIIRASNHK